MKKTILALAVSALSANAFAASVDYSVASPTVNTIATELALPSGNTVTTTDTLTWDLGFSVTAATQRYIRVTLSNGAKFAGNPTLTAGGVAGVISQGGAGQSYAILEVSPVTTLSPAEKVVVTLNNLTLTGKNEVGVKYQLFETAVDAVNDRNELVAKAFATYIKFASGLRTSVKPHSVQRVINVSSTPSSSKFVGALDSDSVEIGGVAVDVISGLVNYQMTSVTLPQLVASGTAIEVEGDFSARGDVKLNGSATNSVGQSATTLTDTKATFVVDSTVIGNPASPTYWPIVYHVNGTKAIVPSSFNATYKVVPVTGASTSSVNLGKIGEIAKNGATKHVDLALKPGGAYQNYVRISNKTSVAGNVYIKLFNDAGQSAQINLGDIAGQASSTLAAQASTSQITIQQIFDAAKAKGFDLAGEGKLRLVVDAEFPGDGGDAVNNSNDYGLSVQTYSVSKDGNSFNTF